jgi:hypothetical protein
MIVPSLWEIFWAMNNASRITGMKPSAVLSSTRFRIIATSVSTAENGTDRRTAP